MLVYQCNSCQKIDDTRSVTSPPSLPFGWFTITINGTDWNAWEYSLCPDCFAKPITFGDIVLHPDPST